MFSLGELSVFREKCSNIERAAKCVLVFHPGEFFVALLGRTQQFRSCSLSLQLLQVSGRSSLNGDQAMGRHLTTQSAPQEANPAASDVLTLCAQLNCTHPVTPCTPSRRSPSWRTKKEKTWVFVFPLGFFFLLFKWLPQQQQQQKKPAKIQPKSLGAAALSEIIFTSLKKNIPLKWEQQNRD